jgi:hypothetical protein
MARVTFKKTLNLVDALSAELKKRRQFTDAAAANNVRQVIHSLEIQLGEFKKALATAVQSQADRRAVGMPLTRARRLYVFASNNYPRRTAIEKSHVTLKALHLFLEGEQAKRPMEEMWREKLPTLAAWRRQLIRTGISHLISEQSRRR